MRRDDGAIMSDPCRSQCCTCPIATAQLFCYYYQYRYLPPTNLCLPPHLDYTPATSRSLCCSLSIALPPPLFFFFFFRCGTPAALDGTALASGGLDNMVVIWDPESGAEKARLVGHKQRINWISWEPLHLAPKPQSTRLASASKDGSVRVWDYTKTGTKMVCSLGQHVKSVTCVKWGGSGLLYTASQDRMIYVWQATTGTLVRQLKGHAHWVNSLSLSTDYVIRTGPYVR